MSLFLTIMTAILSPNVTEHAFYPIWLQNLPHFEMPFNAVSTPSKGGA